MVLQGRTPGLILFKQARYRMRQAPSPCCFWNRISHLCLDLPGSSSSILCFLSNWDDRWVPPCCVGWDVVLLTFCPGWPWTTVLLIFTSQEARITGMSHCAQPIFFLLLMNTKYLYIFIWYTVMFWFMHILSNDQLRVNNISINLSDHFFMINIFEILSSSICDI
jgi:hypothetical protein